MVRGFQTFVLAVLLAVLPITRLACDMACAPAPVPVQAAAPAHCGAHPATPDTTPTVPQDRCGHDHQPVRFIASADRPAPSLGIMTGPITCTGLVRFAAEFTRRIDTAARGGPPRAPRSLVLRI